MSHWSPSPRLTEGVSGAARAQGVRSSSNAGGMAVSHWALRVCLGCHLSPVQPQLLSSSMDQAPCKETVISAQFSREAHSLNHYPCYRAVRTPTAPLTEHSTHPANNFNYIELLSFFCSQPSCSSSHYLPLIFTVWQLLARHPLIQSLEDPYKVLLL